MQEASRRGVWSCGMVAGLINDLPTVKGLIDRIMQQAELIIADRLRRLLDKCSTLVDLQERNVSSHC